MPILDEAKAELLRLEEQIKRDNRRLETLRELIGEYEKKVDPSKCEKP